MRRLLLVLCSLVALGAAAGCGPASSDLTADEEAYLDALDTQIEAIEDSVERFGGLMDVTTPGGEWAAGITEEAGLWAGRYRDAQRLAPPERFAELNATNLDMLRLLSDAGEYLAFAARRTDPIALGDGLDRFWSAQDLAAEVKEQVEDAR